MNLILFLPLILVSFGQSFAQDISTSDFSTGYYLEVEGGGPIYSLELPLEVYQKVRRADLEDVRVFNGAGEVVPHGLRKIATEPETLRQKDGIPFFPLYENSATAGQADLAMRIHRNGAGTIVNIDTAPKPGAEEPRVNGYLLDLSGLKWSLGELAFEWNTGQDASVYKISLHHSNDLQHWSPLVAAATLVDLQHDGERIEKRTIPLPYRPQKYLQLTWQGGGTPLRLANVTGLSQVVQSLKRRQWVDLGNGAVQLLDKEYAVDYQTSMHLPVNSAQMVFHDKNALARIALQSRAADKDGWRTRCEQVFYSLSFATSDVSSEPCVFPPTADPLWRIVVREDGAGIGAGRLVPILQLGWSPNELLFVGRGGPPFMLAFGSAALDHEQRKGGSEMIFQAAGDASGSESVGQARLGKMVELGGDKALQPLPPPQPWKKWLLWGILILGVALLTGMARSLVKEMKKK